MALSSPWRPGDDLEPAVVRFHRDGVTVEAVKLTEASHNAVWEWADCKPFFSPRPAGAAEEDPLPITGLTIFTRGGRRRAEFGDWVIRHADGTFTCCTDAKLTAGYGKPICPECSCDPTLCDTDDSGDSCLDCGSCVHGCPLDECPAHPEVRS